MPPPFWALHAGRRPFLLGRMRIAAALRQFFAARDFVEVETATLVPSPGTETHLDAFRTAAGTNRHARAIVPADLARIRLQEAAGGRRTPDRRVRALVPKPRARHPAPPRIHPGRVVPGTGALRGPDGGLRGYSCACSGGGG